MSTLLALAVAAFMGGPPPAAPAPEAELLDTIAALEDLRVGTAQLKGYTASNYSPAVRRRAFLALGRNNLDDDLLGDVFAAGFEDRDSDVREMVAFAIGQIGAPQHEALLVAQVRVEPERRVVREIWKALGRMGQQAALKAAGTAPRWYRPMAVTAAGLVARRLKLEPWKVAPIKAALNSNVPAVLAAGLYAVSRGRFKAMPADLYKRAVAGLEHADSDVRLQASRVLTGGRYPNANPGDLRASVLGSKLGLHAKAWMLRGWAGKGTATEWGPLVDGLSGLAVGVGELVGPAYHTLAAALLGRGTVAKPSGYRQTLNAWPNKPNVALTPAVTRRMERLRCLDQLAASCTATPEGVRVAAKAGNLGPALKIAADPKAKPALKMAALMALSTSWKSGQKKPLARRSKLLKAALAGTDGPVAAVAADIVAQQKIVALAPDVIAAQKRLSTNVEVAADLIRAVHAIGDEAAKAAVLKWAATTNAHARLARMLAASSGKASSGKSSKTTVGRVIHRSRGTVPKVLDLGPHRAARTSGVVGAWLNTEVGRIALRFDTKLAPLTVANFVRLARKGYYNGVVFHRVVPGFVAQAGDPRGDGWGGPGYTIRCENNPTPYIVGAVGMALAGKDTGGSQWFIALTPQPHLLGTYPVFAHVIAGMDVARKLAQGDVIKSIDIVEQATSKLGAPWTR